MLSEMNKNSHSSAGGTVGGPSAAVGANAAGWLPRAIPAPVRQRIGVAVRSLELKRGLRALRRGAAPDDALLQRLSWAWDNEGFSGDRSYLRRVVEAARAVQGPVLECGSGLTTLLVAACAGESRRACSLEHVGEWRKRVQDRAVGCGLKTEVLDVELVSYGDFDWYRVPDSVPAGIRLVICDGPPGATRGGRYGLLPVCAARLAPGCIILLDDAERDDERRIAEAWQREYGLTCDWRATGDGVFAGLTVPGAVPSGGLQVPAASGQDA